MASIGLLLTSCTCNSLQAVESGCEERGQAGGVASFPGSFQRGPGMRLAGGGKHYSVSSLYHTYRDSQLTGCEHWQCEPCIAPPPGFAATCAMIL